MINNESSVKEYESDLVERTLCFLLKDGKLLEGWGDMVNVDDMTVKFEDPSQLTYGGVFTLNPTDCVNDFIPKAHKDFYYDFRKK